MIFLFYSFLSFITLRNYQDTKLYTTVFMFYMNLDNCFIYFYLYLTLYKVIVKVIVYSIYSITLTLTLYTFI